jgi:hypothetical protein
MATLGDLVYRAASVWKRLVGNTTTTRKFLSQTGTGSASAAPSWDQVTDADLSLSNVTTNNVSISKHGFAPIAPNDATKFLDGTAVYSVPTSAAVKGTTTNDNAAAGYLGEYVESVIASGSAVSLSNATAANIASISLTAGDWDVTGVLDFVLTGATSTDYKAGVSATSATFGGQDSFVNFPFLTTLLSDTLGLMLPAVRFSLTTTTTAFLVAQATFSAGTTAGYGTIRARRVR